MLRKKTCKRMLSGMLAFCMTFLAAATSQAYSAGTRIFAVLSPSTSSGSYVSVGVKGDYVTEAQAALDRINEIRLEACKEGIPNPSDPSKKLTEADYIPIQWSISLERVARVRAAEASFVLGHTRPNGESCFSINIDGAYGSAESLAWNFSSSMLPGIEQWYGEKTDWVNQNANAVTGHYTSMINPMYNYVGLGCMVAAYGVYPNTTAARFASVDGELKTTMEEAVTNCIQLIEVNKDDMINPSLTKVSGGSGNSLSVGDTVSYELTVESQKAESGAKVLAMGAVTEWATTDANIAAVDSLGNVTGKGKGTAIIKATSSNGWSAMTTITVTAGKTNSNNKTTVKKPSVSKVKSVKAVAGSKKLTISWKKLSGAKGYQVQVSTKSNFAGAKKIKISKSKQKYVAKKLKAKKKYYIRIRAYKTYKDENGNTEKAYGGWVKISKKTK